MVNWHDPVLLLRDYLALMKLYHAVGGLYIWETVFSAGFELSILRGKRPYRWTIWIYLGTRYAGVMMFIVFFIHNDAGHVPCKPFILLNYAFTMLSWVLASLIIVLRIIAIWDHNKLASLISVSVLSTAFALSLRTLWQIGGQYDPVFKVCTSSNTHSSLASAIAIAASDATLLLLMFVGLLRRAQGCKMGIWNVLYKQCIIWMVVAGLVEIPPLVFVILNLNAAWNIMLPAVSVAVMSICAARMYRSLCQQGSLTEYNAPSDPPPHLPFPNRNYHHRELDAIDSPSIHFHTRTTSGGAWSLSDRMVVEPFVFVPTAIELRQQQQAVSSADCVSDAAASSSNVTLTVPEKLKSRDGYKLSWHRPVDPTARSFEE